MQDIIYFDAETFYDREYSLSKLTTEEYLRDPRFEVIGVGVKDHPDRPPVWFSGTHREIGEFLAQYEIEKKYLCAHNTVFDGALLAWHFGIRPKYMLDTLSMARPVVGHTSKLSLAALAEKFGIGQKGDEVVAAMGKRRLDFTPAELEAYGRYCRNDIQLCYLLFNIFRQFSTPKELYIIDMLLRMFTDPVLELDREKLVEHLEAVRQRKQELLAKTVGLAGRDELMSNEKFAEVLRSLGVEPPTKISPRTQKETYAFAKNDLAMKALLEHPNEAVQAVATARLGVKSTLEETRTEALIGIAERGTLPVMLNYWGAINTGRASGGDKINPQNFPRGGVIRQAMKAPKGHVVIACDSSQIEARTLAWFACQRDLEEDFRNGVDIYSGFASEIYGYPVDRKRKEIGPDGKEFHPQFLEGFVGKTSILGLGYGMGAARFRLTLANGNPPVEIDIQEAERIVRLYRHRFPMIPALWKEADEALRIVARGGVAFIGAGVRLRFDPDGLHLPNGMLLRYPDLAWNAHTREYTYHSRNGREKLYGAKLIENIIQALARIVVFEQTARIDQTLRKRDDPAGGRRFRVVLSVHDEAVAVVPEADATECQQMMEACMSTPPRWAPDLPIACESAIGISYGDCK